MTTPQRPDRDDYPNPESALGGADAIEKTTYAGNAHGTEPGRRGVGDEPVTARVRSGGPGVIGVVVGILALLAFAIYAIGLFT